MFFSTKRKYNMNENFDHLKTFSLTHSVNTPSLTDEETNLALQKLIITQSEFPKINRRFIDPLIQGAPKYALFSFIKSPDYEMKNFLQKIEGTLSAEHQKELNTLNNRKNVIHGVGKIRGAYFTEEEANTSARKIVQNVDSSNSIFTCVIGSPFALVNEGMSEEVAKIDVKNLVEQTIAENIRLKRIQEQKEKEEILARQDALKSTIKKDPVLTELENYITARVKLAHLRYSIDKHKTERELALKNEKTCIDFLLELESRNKTFDKDFLDYYLAGRKAAGVSDNYAFEGFLKYFADPLVYRDDEL